MSAALGNHFRLWQAALPFTAAWQHQLSREFGKILTASGSHKLHPHHDPSSAQHCCAGFSPAAPAVWEVPGKKPRAWPVLRLLQPCHLLWCWSGSSSGLSAALWVPTDAAGGAAAPSHMCWQVWSAQAVPLAVELLPSPAGGS